MVRSRVRPTEESSIQVTAFRGYLHWAFLFILLVACPASAYGQATDLFNACDQEFAVDAFDSASPDSSAQ